MAGSAHAISVTVCEREERVVLRRQSSGKPRSGRMTSGAGGRPAGGHVIGISCRGEVCFVARVAGGRRACEYVVDVAFAAHDVHMRTGQRKRRVVVIEGRARP